MASGFLRESIEAYSARHPDVSIQVHEGNSAEQIALIRRRQLDVAFVVDATASTDCEVARLWKERLFVVLPLVTSCATKRRSNGRYFARNTYHPPTGA